MNCPKSVFLKDRGRIFTHPAGIIFAAMFVFSLASCDQGVDPIPAPVPVITITKQPAAITAVTQDSIWETLEVLATVAYSQGRHLYQWYSNTSASNQGGVKIDVARSSYFSIPAALTEGTYYYYCEVSASGAETKRSDVATVKVGPPVPIITINTQPEETTVTQGSISGSLSVGATVIPDAPLSYQWYKSLYVYVDGTPEPNATAADFTIPVTLTEGTYYYYCELKAEGADMRYSNVVAVRVNAQPVPEITITKDPAASTTVRQGEITGSLSVEASVTLDAVLNYQWYETTSASSDTDGTPVPNGTEMSFIIPTDLTNPTDFNIKAYYYYCEVTAEGAEAKRSRVATVRVNQPVPVITISTEPAETTTVTQGEITGSLSVEASVTPNRVLNYRWYSNTEKINTGGTPALYGTGRSFTIPTDLTEGTYYYYCEVSTTEADTVVSSVATVKVDPPIFVITIGKQPTETTTVRQGEISGSLNIEVYVWPSAVVSYQWYKNTEKINTGGTAEPNAAGRSFTIPADLTKGTYYYYCEVTPPGVGTVVSSVATVKVDPPIPVITIITQTADTTVREGIISGDLTVAAEVTEDAELSYQWYKKPNLDYPAGGYFNEAIADETGASFTIPVTLTEGTYYYYCEVSATGGAVSVCSEAVTVTVNEGAYGEFVIELSYMDEPVLIDQSAYTAAGTPKVFSIGGTGYTEYEWYLDGVKDEDESTSSYTFNGSAGRTYELFVVVSNAAGEKYSGRCHVTVR